MRKVAAIFLALILTLPFWLKGGILLAFVFNRAYIIEHYCENKGKPQLHCEGKCYFHKQLKKADPVEQDSEVPNPVNWLKKWELPDFDFPGQFFEIQVSIHLLIKSFFYLVAAQLSGFPDRLEQPPDCGESWKANARFLRFSKLFTFQFSKPCTQKHPPFGLRQYSFARSSHLLPMPAKKTIKLIAAK